MDPKKLAELMKAKKAALKPKGKTIKANPGANRYVILSGWRKGEEHIFYHEFGQHFIKNAADEIQAIYPCVDATYGRPCAICSGIKSAMRQTTDDETVELLKKANASQTFLLNVLALDTSEPNVPQILEVKKTVFGQIVDLTEEWGAGMFDADNPQIIVINREGKGLNTKYSTQISPKKVPMPSGIFDKLNNLDDYVRQENEEQQRRALGAVNNVAGLLPMGAGGDAPRTAATSNDSPVTPAATSSVTVEDRNGAEIARQTSGGMQLDEELDDLLSDLTGTNG